MNRGNERNAMEQNANKKSNLPVLLIALLLVFAGAMLAYRYLSGVYVPDSVGSGLVPGSKETAAVTGTETAGAAEDDEFIDAFDFTVYNEDGTTVKLSDFYGKPILINFWATWCSPCKTELPDFDRVYRDYGEDVVFMMVNMTSGRDTLEIAKAFVEEAEYTFPVYYDKDLNAANTYGAYSIPMTVLIDADAHIVGAQVGILTEDILRNVLDNVLNNQK